MLLTPEGKPAGLTDRIMLLAIWTNRLHEENQLGLIKIPKIISAGLGKPTFPVNAYAAKAAENYWNNFWSRSQEARHLLNGNGVGIKTNRDQIVKVDAVIGYGDTRGDKEARSKMAHALTRWYYNKVAIEPQHVLFTVGGAGALRVIFDVIKKKYPKNRIITPFPHYSLYVGPGGKNNLYPIHVMQEPGYCLTAESFANSLEQAKSLAKNDGYRVRTFLMCDPNNPLGTVMDGKELEKIAKILRNNPDILIILDEAYAEMRLDGNKHTSLLCIAPDLKNRIILIRSATKSLSAAGERMAVIVAFDESLMEEFVQENINNYRHAPRSLQHTFAEAMDKLDEIEIKTMLNHYKYQVDYVVERLEKMGAAMPDPHYKVAGTFYVIGDFTDLFGLDLPITTKRALNKTGKIETDEDIAYYLLFNDGVMIAPLSYFGTSNKQGYMHITCSGGDEELITLMDRLELKLLEARKIKHENFCKELKSLLDELKYTNENKYQEINTHFNILLNIEPNETALEIKEKNILLANTLSETKIALAQSSEKRKTETVIKIQSYCRALLAKKMYRRVELEMNEKWTSFVNKLIPHSIGLKFDLLSLNFSERNQFPLWQSYLNNPKIFDQINQIKTHSFRAKL